MIKDDKKRTILIIILFVLLVLLVVFGLVMMNKDLKSREKETPTKEEKAEKKELCVEKMCITEVDLEEINNSKSIYITIENTGDKRFEEICLNIVTNEDKIPVCYEEVEPGQVLTFMAVYDKRFGKTLKDFGLEKIEGKN